MVVRISAGVFVGEAKYTSGFGTRLVVRREGLLWGANWFCSCSPASFASTKIRTCLKGFKSKLSVSKYTSHEAWRSKTCS